MIQWWRNWQQARMERKIFEALFYLSVMDHAGECAVCDDNPEKCICGQLDGCERDCD
jgi:hypothetical protein